MPHRSRATCACMSAGRRSTTSPISATPGPLIVFDVLFRLLRHLYGAEHVTYVRNITDVDDKINARAAERRVRILPLNDAIRRVTERTAKQFHEDVARARLPAAERRAARHRAHRPSMQAPLIDADRPTRPRLRGRGPRAVRRRPRCRTTAASSQPRRSTRWRPAPASRWRPTSATPMDFVLWKPSKPGEPAGRQPCGHRAPGARLAHRVLGDGASSYLGEVFDIHGGGIDLVFPHHENEIAQIALRPRHGGDGATTGCTTASCRSRARRCRRASAISSPSGSCSTRLAGRGRCAFAMLKTHYRQPIDWTRQRPRGRRGRSLAKFGGRSGDLEQADRARRRAVVGGAEGRSQCHARLPSLRLHVLGEGGKVGRHRPARRTYVVCALRRLSWTWCR